MSIYKYLHEDRIENIFDDNLIRFTQPEYFNDPFEVKPVLLGLVNKSEVEENYLNDENIEAILKEEYFNTPSIYTIMTLEQFLFHSKKRIPLFKEAFQNTLNSDKFNSLLNNTHYESFNKKIGILSLTTKNDNLLMWSHYANSHKGFVIEFEMKHNFFNQKIDDKDLYGVLHKVYYQKQRPTEYLSNMSIEKMYLTKSEEWKYEEEYRMFLSTDNADKEILVNSENICLYQIPIELIKSVYCGVNMSDENKSKIISMVKDKNIRVYETFISQEYFKLEFKLKS